LAATIEEKTGLTSELVPGHKGVFEVSVGGKKIYSKHETGRFPEAQEILSQLPVSL